MVHVTNPYGPADVVALALLHLPKWAKEPEVGQLYKLRKCS
jgi:hypothetical protein